MCILMRRLYVEYISHLKRWVTRCAVITTRSNKTELQRLEWGHECI
jgi:hypothetical protein